VFGRFGRVADENSGDFGECLRYLGEWPMNPRFGTVANFLNVQIMLGLCNRSLSLIHGK
jgi:hypothetical protein